MHPIRIDQLNAKQHAELDHADRMAKDSRLRVRALILLLAADRRMVAGGIAVVVRMNEETAQRWLVRYKAEGLNGLRAAPRPGARPKPTRRYGLGAANWHTGETVVLVRRRKRRREIAELLQALVDKHSHERVYVACDNSGTRHDDEVEAVVRRAGP